MADNTTTRVVDIRVETTSAVKGIAEYQIKLEEAKKAENSLKAAIKEQGGATDEQRQQLVQIKETQKAYSAEIRALSKEVQNNIVADGKYKDTLKGLGAELSNAKDQLRAMTTGTQAYADQEKKVAELNQRLKEAEQSYGVFSRDVGNYEKATKGLRTEIREMTEQLVRMKMAGQDNSEEYRNLSIRAAELNDAMGDVNQQTRGLASDTSGLDAMTQAAQGLAGAWGLYNSVLGASIKEDSAAADVMKNLQVAMTALTSITALKNTIQKQSILMQTVSTIQTKAGALATNIETAAKGKNIVVTKAAAVAQAVLNAVMNANPVMLLVTGIGLLVAGFVALTGSSSRSKAQLAEFNSEARKTDAILKQMQSDSDFDARLAEAAGKSTREVLEIKRAGAKKELDLLDTQFEKMHALYNSSNNKTRKKMQEAYDKLIEDRKGVWDKLIAIDADITIDEVKTKTDAAKSAADLRKEALDKELAEVRAAIDAEIALIKDGAEKQLATENATYSRRIADLKKRLATEKNLTATAKLAINKQIEIAEQQHKQNLQQLDAEAITQRIKSEEDLIALKLSAIKKGSDEEYSLKIEQLNKQAEAELDNAKLTAEQRMLIEQKYRTQGDELSAAHANDQLQRSQDALRLEWENKINEAALNHENTLQLELQYRQAELESLHQMEGESDAQFKARQLEAQANYVNAKQAINDYEVEIEQIKLQAMSDVTGAIGGLFEQLGEDSKAFAMLSKVVTLAQIAIDTGRAIAAGTANAMAMPFPANIAAVATTVATVIANITTAIKTVKSAKFATGGYVSGAGTGTSDSISAQLSNGESVNNAVSTSLFTPIYSALNQLGGGVPIVAQQSSSQIAGEDMLARAVAKGVSALNMRVGVDEISRVQSRVSVVESIGDL